MMNASWRIELLGGLRATQGERAITRFRRHKTGALLAFLAYHRHRSYPREELIELLWPESDPRAGHNRLRVALSSLRHQLEPPDLAPGTVLLADRHAVQLNPSVCTTDVAQFEAALRAVGECPGTVNRRQRLLEAAAQYRGELLPGYFEEWIQTERQRLAETHYEILDQLSHLAEQEGDLRGAIDWARCAVSADALREESQHHLIRLLAADGQIESARRQYQALERSLAESCGAAPSPEIRAFARTLERRECPDPARPAAGEPAALVTQEIREVGDRWAAPPARPAAPPVPQGHLPLQLTRFFGREAEIEQLQELLAPHPSCFISHSSRLVTLTGAGGSGKTRLALAAATCLRPSFCGAVWFVPLADVSDPRLIIDKLLDSLTRYRAPGAEVWEQVTTFLRRQTTLLVLDNFEHLVSEGALVVRSLLDEVPTVTTLVTSRQRLGLAGERQFLVAPLPVPEEGVGCRMSDVGAEEVGAAGHYTPHPTPYTLAQCPSVQLFVERAQGVRPDFQLTPGNAAAVVGLCRQLEGLPLALELAAARVGALTPAQMLARLKLRFELLVSRQRDLAPRHRSLWASLDWSYELLSPELQQFFAHLSVFRGGWTLEAAEAVCVEGGVGCSVFGAGAPVPGRTPKTEHPTPILDRLEQLRECSLVLAEETGVRCSVVDVGEGVLETEPRTPRPEHREAEIRFRLLETVREYGAEQLTGAERDALARRHALYYLALAEEAETELAGPDQVRWLERLEQEHDNFRAALDWCVRTVSSGQWVAGLSGNERPAPDADSAGLPPPAARVPAHCPLPTAVEIGLRLGGALGYFWEVRGYWAEGRERLKQLLALPGAEAGTTARAKVLHFAGILVLAHSEPDAARELFTRSLAIHRDLDEAWGAAEALMDLAAVAECTDDYDASKACYEESLAISRRLGNRGSMARALFGLSEVARGRGDLRSAISFASESLELYRQLDNRRGIADALIRLAVMVHHQADHTVARVHMQESLAIARELGDKRGVAGALLHLGGVLRCLGEYEAAAAAYREGLGLWRELGDEWCVAGMLKDLGITAQRRGDHQQALALFAESITRYRELSSRPTTTRHDQQLSTRFTSLCLAGVAEVAAAIGEPERAARLLGAAAAALEAMHADLWPAERTDYDRSAAAVHSAVGEEAFVAPWAAGCALPLAEAVRLALDEVAPLRRR